MLIFDLDDTIFQTNSMNPEIFESAISVLRDYYTTSESNVNLEELIARLWSHPVTVVFSKYNTPQDIVAQFYQAIASIDYSELDIKTYDDYKEINSFLCPKILVTTGFKELQLAKIKALGIESDFDSIYIDDPRENPRQEKLDIFKTILKESQKAPQEVWVIGDNPDSEIKAGNSLHMKTIQRKSATKEVSKDADHQIESFTELFDIVK